MSDHDLDDLARRIAEAGLSALRIPTTGLDAAHVADAILPLLATLVEERDRLRRALCRMSEERCSFDAAGTIWIHRIHYMRVCGNLTELDILRALDAATEEDR